MFWPLSAFYWQKVSRFDRFTFGRGYAFTFRSGEGEGAGALVSACERWCACERVNQKPIKKPP